MFPLGGADVVRETLHSRDGEKVCSAAVCWSWCVSLKSCMKVPPSEDVDDHIHSLRSCSWNYSLYNLNRRIIRFSVTTEKTKFCQIAEPKKVIQIHMLSNAQWGVFFLQNVVLRISAKKWHFCVTCSHNIVPEASYEHLVLIFRFDSTWTDLFWEEQTQGTFTTQHVWWGINAEVKVNLQTGSQQSSSRKSSSIIPKLQRLTSKYLTCSFRRFMFTYHLQAIIWNPSASISPPSPPSLFLTHLQCKWLFHVISWAEHAASDHSRADRPLVTGDAC